MPPRLRPPGFAVRNALLALAAATALWAADGAGARAAPPPPRWHVFLVAADAAEPVFDNAVNRLAAIFRRRFGVAARVFTSRDRVPAGELPAIWQVIGRTVRAEPMGPRDACLFYFTSHGNERGLYMARHRALLTPATLAGLLDRTCGRRPTVLVISACHAGTFLRPGLATRNRIILTAARADRTSFGCSTRGDLTVYDRCFIAVWPASTDWVRLQLALSACVRATERARHYGPPSEPQAFFGSLMRGFPIHPRRNG
jgi:hypothetical protein